MNKADRHNELAREFVLKVAGDTKTHSELMVVVESAILACMHLSQRMYGFRPSGCVEMIEAAVHRATERFSEGQRKGE